jgi:outer membrane protein assembly factor BamB
LGSALLSISAVDAQTLKEIWRSDLGGALAGPPVQVEGGVLVVSSQGDLFQVGQEQVSSGNSDAAVKSSTTLENLLFNDTVELTRGLLAAIGPANRSDLLFVESSKGTSKLLALPPPANQIACGPIALGGDLIIASRGGPVLRIDPAVGQLAGAPFLPPLQPNVPIDWKRPALVSDHAFVIADAEGMFYLIDGADRKSLVKSAELAIDRQIKSPLAANNSVAFVVTHRDAKDQLQAIGVGQDLSLMNAVDLPAGYVDGPWIVDDNLLVLLSDEQLHCFTTELAEKWATKIGSDRIVGKPAGVNSQISVALASGRMLMLDAEAGSESMIIDLGQPISSAPLQVGESLYFPGADGTIHVVSAAEF